MNERLPRSRRRRYLLCSTMAATTDFFGLWVTALRDDSAPKRGFLPSWLSLLVAWDARYGSQDRRDVGTYTRAVAAAIVVRAGRCKRVVTGGEVNESD
jgi:hypothetical protein